MHQQTDDVSNVRLRVVLHGRFGRRRYEVDLPNGRKTTRTPVTLLDPYLGVADAWALVHAANAEWDSGSRDWVTLRSAP